ncbi:MAG: vitamin B12-dependent ribonucleotide reductase [bacterium JZ-2024 1]
MRLFQSSTAQRVLEVRVLRRDEAGKVIETPEEMLWRVARAIGEVENNYNPKRVQEWIEKFYEVMVNNRFLPNSPTLYNAGTELGQLSACFVLPVEDSMEGIFDSLKAAALIHKSGGGTGYSFSRLRPKGDMVKSTGGVASGPVSFMMVFDAATNVIKQGGKRRGANMGILRVDHPDILEFIDCKAVEGEVANFNISVAITEAFMEAYRSNSDYPLINPRTGKEVRRISAKEVMERIALGAWRNGEPGVVFIDEINRTNPTIHLGPIEATNPCAEQPLHPYESCNLGSINLSAFVKNGKVLYEELRDTVFTCVRFLDNVIDANKYPLPEIEKWTKGNRRIGLGVMGFHDFLILQGISYYSQEALKKAEEIMKFIQDAAWEADVALAEEKGPFPNIKGSRYDRPGIPPVRNATRTTIAPTGTLSILAGCSSGIEPIFSLAYIRKISVGEFPEVHPLFEEILKQRNLYSEALIREIAQKGKLDGIPGIPEELRPLFITALEIPPEFHVRVQAAFQKYTDNGVSKTINLPAEATVEDVLRAYLLAYELRCKGLTVYRDRSRERQVLNVGLKQKERAMVPGALVGGITPRPRPVGLSGKTYRMRTEMGNLFVVINSDEKGMFEVFAQIGKSGSNVHSFTEALGRLISLALRSGVDPREIINQLKGIRTYHAVRQDDGTIVYSVPDAIARAMEMELRPDEPKLFPPDVSSPKPPESGVEKDLCPNCGGAMIFQEGCFMCTECGYTRCS